MWSLGKIRSAIGRFVSQSFEGATQGRRGQGWVAHGGGPNTALNGSLPTLRNRSRQAYRNNPWIERAIERNVVNEAGSSITPMFLSTDDAFNEQCERWWSVWINQSDAENTLNFYGQIAQAVRTRRVAGECFIRIRRRPYSWGLAIPFQLQIIEPDHVPVDLNETRPNGNKVVAGKEYDKRGRLVAIWMHPDHPQDGHVTFAKLIRVPASEVIHHYLPLRPGQVRGEPDVVQALLRAKTYDSYEDAELVRKQTKAPFTGFLKKEYESETDWQYDPVTGEPVNGDDPLPEINAQPGTIISGAHGESLTLFDGDTTGQGYSDYQEQQLRAIAAGAKSLYELSTGDWSKINDRLYRAMINEYRREIEMAQSQLCIYQICETVGKWFTNTGVLVGRLEANNYADNYYDYNRRDWAPQRWPHIHPTQDVAATKSELELNLTSLDAEAAKRQKKAGDIQRKNAQAKKRQKDLDKEFGLNEPVGE